MTAALTPPFLVAALVLGAAGLAKLRRPDGARDALAALGVIGVPRTAIRALAAGELGLGVLAVLEPTALLAGAIAVLYATFSVLAILLARRGASCGCFGEPAGSASALQAILSAALAAIAAAAALASPHGASWVAGSHAVQALTLTIGVAGAAYAVVLAYTELPAAWTAWSEP